MNSPADRYMPVPQPTEVERDFPGSDTFGYESVSGGATLDGLAKGNQSDFDLAPSRALTGPDPFINLRSR